jgi:hypothetical protein
VLEGNGDGASGPSRTTAAAAAGAPADREFEVGIALMQAPAQPPPPPEDAHEANAKNREITKRRISSAIGCKTIGKRAAKNSPLSSTSRVDNIRFHRATTFVHGTLWCGFVRFKLSEGEADTFSTFVSNRERKSADAARAHRTGRRARLVRG